MQAAVVLMVLAGTGLLLMPALLIEAIQEHREKRKERKLDQAAVNLIKRRYQQSEQR